MKKSKLIRATVCCLPVLAALTAAMLFAQDLHLWITGAGGRPALAVPDLRGTGAAEPLMAAFNSTLYSDLQSSALFDMKAKSLFPLSNPQQPSDLRPEDARQGYALPDWAGAPTGATHLVFGYTAVSNGALALYGWVYDTRQPVQSAQLMTERLAGTPTEADAIRLAHQFASDIILKFGGSASLLGSRIYFVSSRGASGKTGTELWVMDWDGNNQKQLTFLRGQVLYPAVSPDASRIAFTIFPATGDPRPRIGMVSTDTGRTLNFYNQAASLNAAANFTPDGTHVFYSSSASGSAQIYTAAVDGQGFTRVTDSRGNPTEPKVNPRNAGSLLFVQGPGNEQIYRMNSEGAGIERLTNGEGEASNPSWNPDGQHIAFAWTRGYQAGKFNIFVMDIGSHDFEQLTHGAGNERNENPVWAPDGKHIVFSSTRTGSSQLYTMLADGTQVKQLTTQGKNQYPVWGVK